MRNELRYSCGHVAMVGDTVYGHSCMATVIAINLEDMDWPLNVVDATGNDNGFNPAYTVLLSRQGGFYGNHAKVDAAFSEQMNAIHKENAAWFQKSALLAPHVVREDYDSCCAPAPESTIR